MKIGIVGYARSGKSTLFHWLTDVPPDAALAHATQSAAAQVIDPRVEQLCQVYHPKKVTHATLELVDTPGLSRDHVGNSQRLAHIREAGCLVQVIGAYDGTATPAEDLRNLQEDFLLADMETVSNRVERLKEAVKKPRPNRDEQLAELAAVEQIQQKLDSGVHVKEMALPPETQLLIRSFGLLTEKPRIAVFNLGDDLSKKNSFEQLAQPDCPVIALPVGLELELGQMELDERASFRQELGLPDIDRGDALRKIMHASGQMLFFTAGEKEVRTWLLRQGDTALAAAAGIHTDLARGFIRAEVMSCADLVRLGSERELKAQNLLRQEPKAYVIQDGDVLNIKFSV